MRSHLLLRLVLLLALSSACFAADPSSNGSPAHPGSQSYVVANDDASIVFDENTISYFIAGGSPSAPSLTYQNSVPIGGVGGGGGNFGASSIVSLPSSDAQCLYISNAGSGSIASVNIQSQQLAGTFSGSPTDAGTSNGIGLALNRNYLYASYTDSNTIGTFQILPGCQLSFVNDTNVAGLNGGAIYAIAANANILIVTFGDGSMQSFNVSGGVPISNNDEQNSSGYIADFNNLPAGIDITQDGRYAIFGDGAIYTTVEVSDLSSGKLGATRFYQLGASATAVSAISVLPGVGSSNVRLSPDESLLFISNNQSGNITAGFFNSATGVVSPGCLSRRLSGFYNPWFYLGSMVTENTSGNGGVLYVAEFAKRQGSSIGILNINVSGSTCSFAESPNSPVTDPVSGAALISLWAYPPRPF